MFIKITHDVCDICQRIKEIDENYYVVYNRALNRFELHDRSVKGSFSCVLPFDQLDQRSVEHARKTRVENIQRLMRELEKYNEKIAEGGGKYGL